MWYSQKFEGLCVQYEVGIHMQTGWIVWWNGAFPCGTYPDINRVQQWLIYKLDEDISKVVLVDGGYNNGGQYFIMPSEDDDRCKSMT